MSSWIKDLMASRAFWTGLGPGIVAVFNLIGHPLGTEKVQALTALIMMVAGWSGVTVRRYRAGEPTSYRQK